MVSELEMQKPFEPATIDSDFVLLADSVGVEPGPESGCSCGGKRRLTLRTAAVGVRGLPRRVRLSPSTDKSLTEAPWGPGWVGEDQLRVLGASCLLTPVLHCGPRRVDSILHT